MLDAHWEDISKSQNCIFDLYLYQLRRKSRAASNALTGAGQFESSVFAFFGDVNESAVEESAKSQSKFMTYSRDYLR